ncbi:MAG: MlaD family protein [Acidobacteriia bacterium]|nr:MlaD family protein [Terriglobia bacterium]
MPERSKIRWAQLKVGLVSLFAIAIAATLIFLLTTSQGILTRNVPLRTYMDDASAMQEGTPVRLNGITVGYVDSLQLTNSPDPKRAVEFIMMVEDKRLSEIPVDSQTGIAASNLLGDKFINITKGRSQQHVKAGDELASVQAQDIPQLMAQMAGLITSLQGILGRADGLLAGVEQGKGNLGLFIKDRELYDRLNGIAAEGQKLLADVRTGNGTLSKLIYDDSLYQEFRKPLNRVDAILADLQSGQGTAGKFLKDPALFDEARDSLTQMRGLLADLNAGKGTAGKLLKDDELNKRLNDLLAKFNTTIDKIDAGQGTIGQLMVNPQLYEEISGATHEFQVLAKDIQANPKKFLRIKLGLF